MEKIYIINWDYSHSRDMERDAFHIPFENSDKSSKYLSPMFRMRESSSKLFITERAKSALKKNDIISDVFEEVETITS